MRLESERRLLNRLRDLEDRHREFLRTQPQAIIHASIDTVVPHIAVPSEEPYITFRIRIFNGSVFTLLSRQTSFSATISGRPLRTPASLEGIEVKMQPCGLNVLTFTQPIHDSTTKFLKERIEQHERVRWDVVLVMELKMEEDTQLAAFEYHARLERDEIPFDYLRSK